MSEKSRGVEFHHAPYENLDYEYEPIGELADLFKNSDHVKTDVVKDYVRQIVKQVTLSPDTESQKVCIMDLLREENLKKLLKAKGRNLKTEELQEVEEMTDYWVKKIKDTVVQELKKYLPDDIFLFIQEKQKHQPGHFNKKTVLTDPKTGKVLFLKESDYRSPYISQKREDCLNKLKTALAEPSNAQTKMPFVVSPQLIGKSTKYGQTDQGSLAFTADKEDINTVEDNLIKETSPNVFDYTTISEDEIKKTLSAILDCLRGAKFLAQNNLTVTDLNTEPIGKNFGINKTTGHGILFDLDGLAETGSKIEYLFGPQAKGGGPEKKLFAPEYRSFDTDPSTSFTAESMIWEIGDSLHRLATIQEQALYSSSNFFAATKLISCWEKIREFSEKMTAEKPSDRPTFDICIIKLEEIINQLPDSK